MYKMTAVVIMIMPLLHLTTLHKYPHARNPDRLTPASLCDASPLCLQRGVSSTEGRRRGESDSSEAIKLIQRFADKLRSSSNISFHNSHRYVNSATDDSVFVMESDIWLQRKPADTIFGNVFHVKGGNQRGSHDYYYDGQASVEISHSNKEILYINPLDYPNDDNNPVKARSCLRPLRALWTEKDLVSFLITDYPYADDPAVKLTTSQDDWIINLDYPKNKAGSITQMTLWIAKASGLLWQSRRVTNWNGTVHTETNRVSQALFNSQVTSDSITLTNTYAGYKRKEQKRNVKADNPKSTQWVGMKAPDFVYPSFAGATVSLKQMRGKYVLLDFWETWCGYCVLALPKMKDIYQQYHDKGLEVIGITTENPGRIPAIIQSNGLPYINIKADEKILKDYNVSARPAYVLIDKEGKIVLYNDWEKVEKFLETL
jgi:peroxiredoxin